MDHTSGERRLAADPPGEHADAAGMVSVSRPLEEVSFGAITSVAATPRLQWATPAGLELVGQGVAARFAAADSNRFADIRQAADATFRALTHHGPAVARPRAIGGLSFHDGHEPAGWWTGFESASFVIPRVLVTRCPTGDTWLTVVDADENTATAELEEWTERIDAYPAMRSSGSSPGIEATTRTTSRAEWTAQVESVLEKIDAGPLTKVVIAQALTVDLAETIDVPALLERLRRQYPNCYRFSFQHDDGGTFFGAPPERLVAKRDGAIETEALAGSVPRGDTPAADDEYVAAMLDDEKIAHEHELVVDAIRTQLEPFVSDLTVAERTVRRLATIQHLRTSIQAQLNGDRHVLELVEALHPTPAVGGVPPALAWETIRSRECFDRGWYAAPIGWFDADGDGEFAVGIRSGVATDDQVTLFAGNGLVADSDPADEWDEVQLKFRPILDELR